MEEQKSSHMLSPTFTPPPLRKLACVCQRLRGAEAAPRVLLCFAELHFLHRHSRFHLSSVPPFDFGTMWSAVRGLSFDPVVPQRTHAP